MAYNSTIPTVTYNVISGQTVFTFQFKIFTVTDLVITDQTGVTISNTLYTVVIDGDIGGTVTFGNTPTATQLTLFRSLQIDRETEYQINGDLRASTLNNDQDYQTYLIADKQVKVDYLQAQIISNDVDIATNVTNIASNQAQIISNDVDIADLQYRIDSGGTGGTGGGQLIGNAIVKGVQYMAKESSPTDAITIRRTENAFSVDSFTIQDGASLTLEDGAVYKII